LIIACHILRDGVASEDPGADYLARRNPEAAKRRAVRQLEELGFSVTLESAA